MQRGALLALSRGLLLALSVTLRYGRHNFLVRWLEALHGLLCTARQQGGSTHILGFAANYLVGDHRLIGINGDVFDGDLPLSAAAMMVEPLRQ